jgi:hypothetical protein
MDKHKSSLRKSVNYGRNKFYDTGPKWHQRCHDTQYNDVQHNDTQHNEKNATLSILTYIDSVIVLGVFVMLTEIYAMSCFLSLC